jgi:hypothetical protein
MRASPTESNAHARPFGLAAGDAPDTSSDSHNPCARCGLDLEPNDHYCDRCGEPQREHNVAAATEAAQSVSWRQRLGPAVPAEPASAPTRDRRWPQRAPLFLGVILATLVFGMGVFLWQRPVAGSSASWAGGSLIERRAFPRIYVVANTNGYGVYPRRTPSAGDRMTPAYEEGTQLKTIGDDVVVSGTTWRHVLGPDGREGYVAAQYTRLQP